MKIDLHVHASERSACSTASEISLIQAAIQAGLNGIAFSDHNRLVGHDHLIALNQRFAPFKIFTGIEVDCDQEHWVIIGIDDPRLEQIGWRYPDLHAFVQEKGGYMLLAHPFRYHPIQVDIRRYPPDGVEISSYNTPPTREADIRALSAELGLALHTNSDAHRTWVIGQYFTQLPATVENDASLIQALRERKPTRKPAVFS